MQKCYYTWTTAQSHVDSFLGPPLQAEQFLSRPLLIGEMLQSLCHLAGSLKVSNQDAQFSLHWGAQNRTRPLGPLRTHCKGLFLGPSSEFALLCESPANQIMARKTLATLLHVNIFQKEVLLCKLLWQRGRQGGRGSFQVVLDESTQNKWRGKYTP